MVVRSTTAATTHLCSGRGAQVVQDDGRGSSSAAPGAGSSSPVLSPWWTHTANRRTPFSGPKDARRPPGIVALGAAPVGGLRTAAPPTSGVQVQPVFQVVRGQRRRGVANDQGAHTMTRRKPTPQHQAAQDEFLDRDYRRHRRAHQRPCGRDSGGRARRAVRAVGVLRLLS